MMIKEKMNLTALGLLMAVGFAGCSNGEMLNHVRIDGTVINEIIWSLNTDDELSEKVKDIGKHIVGTLDIQRVEPWFEREDGEILKEAYSKIEKLSYKGTIGLIYDLARSNKFDESANVDTILTSSAFYLALKEITKNENIHYAVPLKKNNELPKSEEKYDDDDDDDIILE